MRAAVVLALALAPAALLASPEIRARGRMAASPVSARVRTAARCAAVRAKSPPKRRGVLLGLGSLAVVANRALADEEGGVPSEGTPSSPTVEVTEEKPMSAIEKLKERQRKALSDIEVKSERITYEDGSVTIIYPRSTLDELRIKDPVVRQRLASPGRGGIPKEGFPFFVRDGYTMKMFLEDTYERTADGLNYMRLAPGKGVNKPKDGQKVVFDFTAYNENGDQIDTSLRKSEPPQAKLGLGTIVPGVEMALKQMTVGERWRIIVSPDLGPPTGPSTFFSAKQFETFDIELKDIKDCTANSALFVTKEECTTIE